MLKKSFICFLALVLAGISLSAQESPIQLHQSSQSISGFITVSANSFFPTTTGIMYNYYLKDDLALRANVRVGYNKNVTEVTYGDSSTKNITETGNNFRLGAGLQKSLVKSRRFNGYASIDALAGLMKAWDVDDDSYYSTYYESVFEFGLRPAMGIEFHFVNNFFVGMEFGYDVIFDTGKKDKNTKIHNTILDVADLSSATVRLGFMF